jgi:hypothetical protein
MDDNMDKFKREFLVDDVLYIESQGKILSKKEQIAN